MMRAEAKIQIEQRKEEEFRMFCKFLAEIALHDSVSVLEGLAECQKDDNEKKYGNTTV